MKKFSIILVCLVLLGIGAYYAYDTWLADAGKKEYFSTWKKFVPSSKLFEVYLPNPPQYGKDFIKIPDSDKNRRYDMYASEKLDGSLFLISVITYPPEYDTSQSLTILRQNIDELMHQKAGNHLNTLLNKMFQNHSSVDFDFENKEFKVEGRAVHDDHIVYMLSYITKKENYSEDEYDFFINSFKILKPSKEVIRKNNS